MPILLTDEEIMSLTKADGYLAVGHEGQEGARVVAKAQLKKVVEWLIEAKAEVIFQGLIEEELWENLVKELTNDNNEMP